MTTSFDRIGLHAELRLPLFAAPMFLVSGPALITAAASAGIVGALPSMNARTPQVLDTWLAEIERALEPLRGSGRRVGLPALNLITHPSNTRFEDDLAVCINHRVPIVVSAVGSPARAIEPVHRYGGAVYADVSTIAHARKAVAAGVDGLVLLCAGAGGNTGRISPFAFVSEVRRFFDGPIGVAGAVADGRSLRALQVLGADFGYAGTAFIATHESQADEAYRQMVVEAGADDIELTSDVSGIPANFLRQSLDRARHQFTGDHEGFHLEKERENLKRWKDIWSAGHGVGTVQAVRSVAEVVDEFERGFREAGGSPAWAAT